MTGMLAPGGCLYIGHSENLPAHQLGLAVAGRTIFRLDPASGRRAA
jgi:chemotaxis methyl-accepting protein methylase